MAQKKQAEFTTTIGRIVIVRDLACQEYVCKVYRKGKRYEPADYYTSDFNDALKTASFMVKEENRIDPN